MNRQREADEQLRQERFRNGTWAVRLCPVCAGVQPRHNEPCLSNDPPSLRPDHVVVKMVVEEWRDIALRYRSAAQGHIGEGG